MSNSQSTQDTYTHTGTECSNPTLSFIIATQCLYFWGYTFVLVICKQVQIEKT